MNRLSTILIASIVIVTGLSCGGAKKQAVVEEKPVSVTVIPARTQNLAVTRVYSGSLEGLKQANIYASIPVAVVDLPISEGSEIQAGQAVIILDKQGVASQFQQAEAVYTQARDDFEKMGRLYNEGAISEQAYNGSKTSYDVARANYLSAKQQIELTSPISGVLTDLGVNVGQYVGLGVPLATVAQIDKMRLTIYVDSRGATFIKSGQRAVVTVDTEASGQSDFDGVVTEVARSADPDTRLFKVEIQIDNGSRMLRPGMFARASITVEQLENVLTVPRESVFIFEGVAKVFKANGNRSHEQTITLGESTAQIYQVTGGISEGDSIIVLGRSQVEDGTLIKIVSQGDTLSNMEG